MWSVFTSLFERGINPNISMLFCPFLSFHHVTEKAAVSLQKEINARKL